MGGQGALADAMQLCTIDEKEDVAVLLLFPVADIAQVFSE
jgi:hypothetical protein